MNKVILAFVRTHLLYLEINLDQKARYYLTFLYN